MKAEKKFDFFEYNRDYKKLNYKRIVLWLPLKEPEVLEKLNSVESKRDYIVQLIKQDINKK